MALGWEHGEGRPLLTHLRGRPDLGEKGARKCVVRWGLDVLECLPRPSEVHLGFCGICLLLGI